MCMEDAIMGMCPPPDESGKIKVVVEVDMPQPPAPPGTSIVDRNHSYATQPACMIPPEFMDMFNSMMSFDMSACDAMPCEEPAPDKPEAKKPDFGKKADDKDKDDKEDDDDESGSDPKRVR